MHSFPVFIVEDNPKFSELLRRQLTSLDRSSEVFRNVDEMIAKKTSLTPGILLVDLHLPGSSGLELISRISDEHWPAVAVVLSGSDDVNEAIDAFRNGAIDFLRKPHRLAELDAALTEAADALTLRLKALRKQREAEQIRLSPREGEVLGQLAEGLQSKLIAHNLGISVRTVELHRSKIIAKLGARSAGHAVLLARELGLIESAPKAN